jgi:hypothetical protein
VQLNNVEYSKQQSVYELAQEPPRLDAREAALAVGVTCLAALVGALGVLLFGASFPMHGPGGALNFAGMLAGSTCLLAWAFVLLFVWHHIEKWRADLRYERERREAVLEAHWKAQGLVTTEVFSETTITADNPGQIILAALALHQRRNDATRPYSVRALQKPLFLSLNAPAFGGTRQLRIGQAASEQEAQRLAELFARCGLISGRREKTAGEWTAQTASDVLANLLPEYAL